MTPDTRASDLFTRHFYSAPEVLACSPGRVEILGNHTDYNQGVTLSAAIDNYVYVAIGRRDGPGAQLASTQFPDVVTVAEFAPQTTDRWVNYILGVAAIMRREGFDVGPFNAAIHGDVPLGAGLSSSAALEVATGLALARLFGITLDKERLARICQQAEHEFCGSKCGLLDQYSVIFGEAGKLLFIDFRSFEHRTVALPSQDVALAITPSGVTHSLGESAYNERRAECFAAADHFAATDSSVKALRDVSMSRLSAAEGALQRLPFLRARHIVGENERVMIGMELLNAGDLTGFGRLLLESHESSRVNFENSCPDLDTLVDIARDVPGVYGSRLSGGGFGGATVTLLPGSSRDAFSRTVADAYPRRTGRTTTVHFASLADGARVLDNPP